MAKIYVGRWDLLPKEWEGINGLYERGENEIEHEALEEERVCMAKAYDKDYIPGVYSPVQFEETFNGDNEGTLNGTIYWIKIF